MDLNREYDRWPKPTEEALRSELRLPRGFMSLVADRNITNDEIGRLLRCLSLDSDYFITPRIEADLFRFRAMREGNKKNRERIREWRSVHHKGKSDKIVEPDKIVGCGHENACTVTDSTGDKADKAFDIPPPPPILSSTISSEEKRKNTPYSPPKKENEKSSSSTKKIPFWKYRWKKKADALKVDIQQDLFALASSTGSAFNPQELTKNNPGCSVLRSLNPDNKNTIQDIESDSRAISDGFTKNSRGADRRDDAAWIPSRFSMFWEAYPKKVAKGDANKAFTKLIKTQPDVDKFMNTLMASLMWWKSQNRWTKDGGKYIPHPATWLNRGSWQDSEYNDISGSAGAQYLCNGESDAELLNRLTNGG